MTQPDRNAILPEEGYLTTEEGIRLYFQKFGNGPKTVLIPNGLYLTEEFARFAGGRTLIFYDLRNRGRSDAITDDSKLKNGIHHDVDDLEAVRRHFRIRQPDVIGHSYVGLTVVMYAMKYPANAGRVVQIGPMQPSQARQYPAHLTWADDTLREVFAQLADLQKERQSLDPVEFCKKFWSLLRVIYVANPADAEKINWGRCELPNERNALKFWGQHIFPSIRALHLAAEDFAKVKIPVLTIHGKRDRSSPYGGGREWALLLPNARLVTLENAAHAPWVEAPETVFGSIQSFLDGAWPEEARKVLSLDPADEPALQP
jgi:pimeloyl-ACP methyl ester carboxylesterase